VTNLDIARLRADTPACERLIHFNNAGSSLMPTPVYQAVLDHLALEQSIGGYDAEDDVCPVLEDFYVAFAALLNCERSEIAYVENATRAWDMAFYSLPLKEGDRILTVEAEYVSNFLAYLHQARRRGLEIDVAPCDASGQVDLDALERLIGPKTRLIAVTHIPTQGGLVNPAEEIGKRTDGRYEVAVSYLLRRTDDARDQKSTMHVESTESSTVRWNAQAGGVYLLRAVAGDAKPAPGPAPRSRISKSQSLGTSWLTLEVSDWFAEIEQVDSIAALGEPVLEHRAAWQRYESIRQ
jgi:hypothetical protein